MAVLRLRASAPRAAARASFASRRSRAAWRARAALASAGVHSRSAGRIVMQSTGQGATQRSQPLHSEREHAVHPLWRADDRVDGACADAQRATDARAFVDVRDSQRTREPPRGIEAGGIAIEHSRERCERASPPGGQRLMSAAPRRSLPRTAGIRVTAARALRLRQQVVDPVDKVGRGGHVGAILA